MTCQRDAFIVDDDINYLTFASIALRLKRRHEAETATLESLSKVWTIQGKGLEQREELRKSVSLLLNCNKEDIAWVASTGHAVSLVANNLLKLGRVDSETTILILENQFWSNVYAWQQLANETKCTLKTVDIDTNAILSVLNEESKLIVALPTVLWINGALFDLKEIANVCKEKGHFLFLDATQTLGAEPLDIQEIDPDFLCASCYKWMLGSVPGAILYAKKDPWHTIGIPLEYHQLNTEKFVGSDNLSNPFDPTPTVENNYYPAKLSQTAARFDIGGNPDRVVLAGMNEALSQILEWGVGNIQNYLRELTNKIATFFRNKNIEAGFDIFQFPTDRTCNIIGIEKIGDPEFAVNLASFLRERNVYVIERYGYLRVSPYLHTSTKDLEEFFKLVDEFIEENRKNT